MPQTPSELVREGVEALLRGDLQRIEQLLADDVEWAWFEPGGEDVAGRDAVLAALRERVEQGVLGGLVELVADGDEVVVGLAPSPAAADLGAPVGWARVRVGDGHVTRLVSYDSRDRALGAT
jgi:ketosteroid isomerase-like protein